MTTLELVILMVVATVCIICGVGICYQSIANTIERYQIRKQKRELETFVKIMEQIPKVITAFVDTVYEKSKKAE